MRTHVYCLLPAGAEPPPAGLRGVGGAPVRRLACGAVDAWVGDVAGEPNEGGPAAVVAAARAHDGVARAALAAGVTPLPARFGQRYPDDAACAAALARRAGRLARAAARVAGAVEMTVIVPIAAGPDEAPAPAGAGPGRRYLERVRRRLAPEMRYRASAVRRRITETVGALVRDEAVAVNPSPAVAPLPPYARVAHLLDRARVGDYRGALDRLSAELLAHNEIPAPLRVLGPDAPYTFAGIDADE